MTRSISLKGKTMQVPPLIASGAGGPGWCFLPLFRLSGASSHGGKCEKKDAGGLLGRFGWWFGLSPLGSPPMVRFHGVQKSELPEYIYIYRQIFIYIYIHWYAKAGMFCVAFCRFAVFESPSSLGFLPNRHSAGVHSGRFLQF